MGQAKPTSGFPDGHGTGAWKGWWVANSNWELLVCNKESVLGCLGWLLDASPKAFLNAGSPILHLLHSLPLTWVRLDWIWAKCLRSSHVPSSP